MLTIEVTNASEDTVSALTASGAHGRLACNSQQMGMCSFRQYLLTEHLLFVRTGAKGDMTVKNQTNRRADMALPLQSFTDHYSLTPKRGPGAVRGI